jgi:cation diffusion facilitator CzcD-associated flavoprotein CzcO
LDSFAGYKFHSAQWNHQVELKGQTVAVVGTGALAIQFVPKIQPLCAQLTVFQRTAPWVLPKRDFAISSTTQRIFERYPVLQVMLRKFLFIVFEVLNYCLRFRTFVKLMEWATCHNITRSVKGNSVLANVLTPTFSLGCKRILQSNSWYPALV